VKVVHNSSHPSSVPAPFQASAGASVPSDLTVLLETPASPVISGTAVPASPVVDPPEPSTDRTVAGTVAADPSSPSVASAVASAVVPSAVATAVAGTVAAGPSSVVVADGKPDEDLPSAVAFPLVAGIAHASHLYLCLYPQIATNKPS